MKVLMTLVITALTLSLNAQDKYNYTEFNKLEEIDGTDFVMANIENRSKIEKQNSSYLLFIDTKTGQTNQVDFIYESYLRKVEQVKIDELGINILIVNARNVIPEGKRVVNWDDPRQIIVLSTDGKQRTQLTDSKLFVRTWVVNRKTGTIVITGHYDTNNNGKYDKTDKNEIGIYDLKNLKLISKI